MVVYKNKQYMKCNDFPDTDFNGDADWVLNDNDENDAAIEAKIIEMYPNFDFVLSEDGCEILDVSATEQLPMPPEPPTNAELAAAIAELAEVICNG